MDRQGRQYETESGIAVRVGGKIGAMRVPRIIAAAGLLVFACGCMNSRRPSRYLIPAGYVGPVRVQYGIRSAPAVKIEDGRYLFSVPASGTIQTSSSFDGGVSEPDEYYYVDGKSRKRIYGDKEPYQVGTSPPIPMIWGGEVGSGTDMPVTETWFVGTKKQYEEFGKTHSGWPY